MTNRIITSLAVAAAFTASQASPRTPQQARDIAARAMPQHLNIADARIGQQQPQHAAPRAEASSPAPYYLFTDDAQRAFVLVSGSDLLPEVLGYGTIAAGHDAGRELPPAMRGWLADVARLQDYVEQHPEAAAPLQQRAQAVVTPVSKLLTTDWGQDEPYNEQCPQINGQLTATGCMATSISQVINHAKYPQQFTGSYSYDDKGKTRSLDFTKVDIDYSLLLDRYNRYTSGEEERAEVAELMYSVGIAANMEYGLSPDGGSGAVTQMAHRGLVKNLGSSKAQYLYRRNYTLDEWNEILQYELHQGRPVVMDGHNSEGGHSFVVDGLDERGYYHVNWGWDGYQNGWFDVSVLHPDAVGTGAAESADGFTGSQDIIVNIGDPSLITRWYSPLVVSSDSYLKCNRTSAQLGQAISLSTTVLNNSCTEFSGYLGVIVMKDGEVYKQEEGSSKVIVEPTIMKSKNGWFSYISYGSRALSRSLTLPEDMPEGEYQVYLYARPDSTEQYDFVRQNQKYPNYWRATVSGESVTLSNAQSALPLEVQHWSLDDEPVTTRPTTIKVTMLNTGASSTAVVAYASIARPDGTVLDDLQAKRVLTIAAGETDEAEFDVVFDQVGEWEILLAGVPVGNDANSFRKIATRTFDVVADPTYGANFTIVKKLDAACDKVYNVGPVSFSMRLRNDGLDYHGQMSVRLYSNKTNASEKYLQAEIVNPVDFPAGETQDVIISGDLNITKLTAEKATLYARAYYLRGETMEQLTTSSSAITVYRNDDAGIEDIRVDEDATGDASFDVFGRKVMGQGHGLLLRGGEKTLVR